MAAATPVPRANNPHNVQADSPLMSSYNDPHQTHGGLQTSVQTSVIPQANAPVATIVGNSSPKDQRIDHVVSLLGEYMPSDPGSPLASYLPGFMSLRLMLLRPTRSHDEEELMRTVLASFSSYTGSGRPNCDIAVMLARDYMFLTQQQPHQMMGMGQTSHQGNNQVASMPSSHPPAPAYNYYHPPNNGHGVHNGANPSYHNSPAMAPIPVSGNGADSASIVSA